MVWILQSPLRNKVWPNSTTLVDFGHDRSRWKTLTILLSALYIWPFSCTSNRDGGSGGCHEKNIADLVKKIRYADFDD
jgi:hypothetical protein